MGSQQILSFETLRERLITREGQSIAATRGSLSKCAIRLRGFVKATQIAELNKNDETVSAVKLAANELTTELRLHEVEMKKMALGARAVEAELLYYDKIGEETQKSISSIRDEIEELRACLLNETKVRKNREEYEALAKMASDRPSSRVTKRKLQDTEAEMVVIRKETKKVQKKLDVKEKQFLLLTQSISDFKSDLEEDKHRERIEKESQ